MERRVSHLSGWRCKLDNGWPWEHVVHIRDVYNGHLIPLGTYRGRFNGTISPVLISLEAAETRVGVRRQWQLPFAAPDAEALGHVTYFYP